MEEQGIRMGQQRRMGPHGGARDKNGAAEKNGAAWRSSGEEAWRCQVQMWASKRRTGDADSLWECIEGTERSGECKE